MGPKSKARPSQGKKANNTKKKKTKSDGVNDAAAKAKVLAEMDETTADRYVDDAKFRKEYGPSVWLHGEHGYDCCLIGLTMNLDFGSFGTCRGIVRAVKDECNDDESLFSCVWTCSPDYKTEYELVIGPNLIQDFYFLDKSNGERPHWLDKLDFGKGATLLSLKDNKLVDWHVPCEIEEIFPSEDEDIWNVTISRLNDPIAACLISPETEAYPTSLVLTVMLIVATAYDPSVQLPIIVTEDNKVMFQLADQFTRQLSGSGGQLYRLEAVVKSVAATVLKEPTDVSWLKSYQHVQALILTLSYEFEEAIDSWIYDDNDELQFDVVRQTVETVVAVVLHPPSPAMKALVEKDTTFLRSHLKAIMSFSPFFDEYFHDSCKVLPEYLAFCDSGDDSASNEAGPNDE